MVCSVSPVSPSSSSTCESHTVHSFASSYEHVASLHSPRVHATGRFEPHVDGYYMRPNGEQSMLTFMLYLNGGFEGGETSFQSGLSIKPEAGMILVFRHALYHEGAAVVSGRKYVLRSDVMFSL